MLKQRVMTGLLLTLALLAAIFTLSVTAFAIVLGGVVMLAAWEWAALTGLKQLPSRVAYMLLVIATLLFTNHYTAVLTDLKWENARDILGIAGLWWAFALLWVKSYPLSAGLWGGQVIRGLMGILVLVPTWLGLVYLRQQPDGALMVVYVFLIVACADIGAYFTGRAWGKRKLAPQVSPGKTLEGFLGGLVLVMVLGAIVALARGMSGQTVTGFLVITLITAVVSVLGDLLESMVKRHVGVKDSGNLLPGHGGILDRIDSITAAAPVFALSVILVRYSG